MNRPGWNKIKPLITPNSILSQTALGWLFGIEALAVLLLWSSTNLYYFPTPYEIFKALGVLFSQFNLAGELMTSLALSLESILIATAIGLIITYLIKIPILKFIPVVSSKFRFLTLVGLTFVFQRMMPDAHGTKVLLLVFSMSVFFITSMVSAIQAIPVEEFNLARTLRMNEWQVMWEVVILGKFDMAFEIVRQNFAITWAMLTMVEVISQADGGVGVLLWRQNKFLNFDMVFAIQLSVLVLGVLQDWLLGAIKVWFMPYSKNRN